MMLGALLTETRTAEHSTSDEFVSADEATLTTAFDGMNLGEFPMSDALVSANDRTLSGIDFLIGKLCRGTTTLKEVQDMFGGEEDLPSRIIASYLGAVASHTQSLNISWFEIDESPAVQLSAALHKKGKDEDTEKHRDHPFYPSKGLRCLTVNKHPTPIDGIEDFRPGQIATMVHGVTWHWVPHIDASNRYPRLRLALDLFLDDPSGRTS